MEIKGLKKASGETRKYSDSASYDEVFFNKETGEIWTVYQYSLGMNTWTEYHDPNVVKLVNATRHYTMKELKEMCERAI